MQAKNQTQRIHDLLGGVTEELLLRNPQPFEDNSIRVERLLLETVRPDPVQPRRVLPEQLHFDFHNNRLTPTQALKALVQLVQVAARQRGRPFNNVLELLPNSDDEGDEDRSVHLSPEEQLLHDLVNLAVTIRDDGQVNPLTVVDISQGVTRQFRIETGERRYRATWLLRDFIAGYGSDGMIPYIIIPAGKGKHGSQRIISDSDGSAGCPAFADGAWLRDCLPCRIERLLPSGTGSRPARQKGIYGRNLAAMGSINKTRLAQYKALLHLSDEAMELSDRYGIDERKLRHVNTLPQEYHAEVVRQIIDLNLTATQVKELCEGDLHETSDEDPDKIPASAIRIAKTTQATTAALPQDIARALIRQEGDISVARARLQALRKLLTDVERYLVDE